MRGTGRLRLLLAKMLTLAIIGILLLAGYLVIAGGIIALLVNAWNRQHRAAPAPAQRVLAGPGHVGGGSGA